MADEEYEPDYEDGDFGGDDIDGEDIDDVAAEEGGDAEGNIDVRLLVVTCLQDENSPLRTEPRTIKELCVLMSWAILNLD